MARGFARLEPTSPGIPFMSTSLRALRALVLLAGFYLMGVLLLAVLAVADWLLLTKAVVNGTAYLVVWLLGVSVAIALPILSGMVVFLLAGRRHRGGPGVPVEAEQEPDLWDEVRAAAQAAGTRAPDAVRLVDEVNAAVAEQTRFMGLVPGRRHLYLGMPLLAGLTVPQLRAVLAHEFGHFTNHDTRLSAVTMRGRRAVEHTIGSFRRGSRRASALVGGLYVRYGNHYLKTTQAMARQQELAADDAAARHGGRASAAAALARVPMLDAVYEHYLDDYAKLGVPLGALPPVGEFFGAFPRLLAARDQEALSVRTTTKRPSPYDSHPPMAERVARIEALPDDGRTDDLSAPPALTLLRDRIRWYTELESHTLSSDALAMKRLDWPDLLAVRFVADTTAEAEPLQTAVRSALRIAGRSRDGVIAPRSDDGPPDLDDVLAAIDDGLLWMAIADRMPKPAQATRLTGQGARDYIRPAVQQGLASLVTLRLISAGLTHPELSWAGRPRLDLPAEHKDEINAALAAAVADMPETAPLRAALSRTKATT